MKGILIIAHGSKEKETETAIEAVVSMVRTRLPEIIIEWAFWGFSERTIERGVAALVARGIREIKIVPYFLAMGIHLKENIPRMADQCAQNFPGIKITMGEPFGVDQRLADILVDRISNF
ncbi:MAG: CbiX/SirB N-terminal domain-containing protein [Treponema sp.]|nr:CbiX/SirB N-terminal domain-containing protein [Treponema sp.]